MLSVRTPKRRSRALLRLQAPVHRQDGRRGNVTTRLGGPRQQRCLPLVSGSRGRAYLRCWPATAGRCHAASPRAPALTPLRRPPAQLFDEAFRAPFPSVTRWFLTCVHQPEFARVMGDAALAKEALKHAPAKAAAHAAPKEAAAAAPKQLPPAAKPAPKAESKPAPEKARGAPLSARSGDLCCSPLQASMAEQVHGSVWADAGPQPP